MNLEKVQTDIQDVYPNMDEVCIAWLLVRLGDDGTIKLLLERRGIHHQSVELSALVHDLHTVSQCALAIQKERERQQSIASRYTQSLIGALEGAA